MYRVCITKKPKDVTALDRFLNKENDILWLYECLQLSESNACCQKKRFDRIVALCILLKRLSYTYRYTKAWSHYLGETQLNFV